MNNKNGQVIGLALVNIIIPFIAVMALILAFSFSTSLRWVMIGIACIAGGLWLISSVKSDKIKLTFGILLFGAAVIFVFAPNLMQQTFVSTDMVVQAPMFGYIKCDPTGSIQGSSIFEFKGNKDIGCFEVGPTTGCKLVLNSIDNLGAFHLPKRIIVTDKLANTVVYSTPSPYFTQPFSGTVQAVDLVPGTYNAPRVYNIKIEYQGLLGWREELDATTKYSYNYQPFIIKRYDSFSSTNGQAINMIGKTACTIDTSTKGDIITSTTIDFTSKEGSPSVLEPNEAYTYFTRHVTVPSFSTGTDVADAYCVPTSAGGTLYKIETVTTTAGTYKVVSPTYSDAIKTVQCCDGDSVPGKVCRKNLWVDIAVAACSITKPCPNDQNQRDVSDPTGKTVVKYSCINSKCVPITATVECTNNEMCNTMKAGTICGADFKCRESCVDCNPENTCGNGKCESWENSAICGKDCKSDGGSTCTNWWEQSYTKTTKDYGFLYWRAILGNPLTNSESGCKTATWVNILIIGGFMFVLGIVVITIWMPKKKKGKKRRI